MECKGDTVQCDPAWGRSPCGSKRPAAEMAWMSCPRCTAPCLLISPWTGPSSPSALSAGVMDGHMSSRSGTKCLRRLAGQAWSQLQGIAGWASPITSTTSTLSLLMLLHRRGVITRPHVEDVDSAGAFWDPKVLQYCSLPSFMGMCSLPE